MTWFANSSGRIRIIDIDRETSSGPHGNLRCTRAFTCERFSHPPAHRPRMRPPVRSFGSVSIAFQSASRLPLIVRIAPRGTYVFDRGWRTFDRDPDRPGTACITRSPHPPTARDGLLFPIDGVRRDMPAKERSHRDAAHERSRRAVLGLRSLTAPGPP